MTIGIDVSRGFIDQPTGTERYTFEMVTHLLQLPESKEHSFVLFAKAGQLQKIEASLSSKGNVRVIEIGMKRLWTQIGLALQTWTSGIDMLWVPAHTLPVLRKPGLKTVVTVHGIEYEWLPAYENVLQRWYLPLSTQYAVATATKIVAVSEFTKQQLVERLHADKNKIKMIHEGYSRGHKKTDRSVLNKHNLTEHKYVVFVGTVQPRKNLARLVEAFANLDNPDLKLVIAGKLGWNYQDVMEAIKRLKMEDRVVMTGYISDTERYTLLYFGLFYIQSSITEGFGLPILEAWDAGLAVASSNGGALSEVSDDAAVLFDPTDMAAISDAMRQLSNLAKRKEYVDLGKKRLLGFSWQKAVVSVLELFNLM